MAGLIQTVPVGLIQALGLKGGGNLVPQVLSDGAVATIDGEAYWLDQSMSGKQGTTLNATAIGQSVTVTVPTGERWLVDAVQASIGAIVNAGDRIRVSLSMVTPDGSSVRIYSPPQINPAAAGDFLSHGVMLPKPRLLSPGMGISLLVEQLTLVGANVPVNVAALCAVLR
jgi:hypothetical protein